MSYIDVRDPHDKAKLLFRYDPARQLVAIKSRQGPIVLVDLSEMQPEDVPEAVECGQEAAPSV